MPPAGFEPATLASEGAQTHALDRAATGIGNQSFWHSKSEKLNFEPVTSTKTNKQTLILLHTIGIVK